MDKEKDMKSNQEEIHQIRNDVMEFTKIGLIRFNFYDEIYMVDENALKLLEISDYESTQRFIEKKYYELFSEPPDYKDIQDSIAKDKEIHNYITKIKTVKGNVKWLRNDAYRIFDVKRGKDAIQLVIQDITEQYKIQNKLKESQEKFKTLFEFFPNTLIIISEDGTIEQINQKFFELFEIEDENPVNIHDFFIRIFRSSKNKEFLISVLETDIENAKKKDTPPRRFTITTENGNYRDVIFRTIDIKQEGILILCEDYTHQHKMETELLNFASKRYQLEKIINRSPAIVVSWLNVKGRPVEYISENINEFGYTSGEFLSHNVDYVDIMHPADKNRVLEESRRYSQQQELNRYHQEYRILTKNGDIRWVSDDTMLLRDPDGRIVRYQGIITDITEKKNAIRNLEFERQQFLSIFDSIAEPIYVADPNTYEIVYVNSTLEKMIGYNPVGKTCHKIFQNLDEPCTFCTNEIILNNNKQPYRWEYHNPRFKKDYFIMDRIITWPDGRDVRFEIAYDITEQKQAEEELAAEKELLTTTLRNIKDGVFTLDENGEIILVNDAAVQILGIDRSNLLLRRFDDIIELYDVEDNQKISVFRELNNLKTIGKTIETIAHLIDNLGVKKIIEYTGALITSEKEGRNGSVVVIRDVTEQKRLEEEVFKRQKIESIQLIAGGIAHDFNNLLTSILGNVSLLKYECNGQHSDILEILEDAERASMNARQLTNQLLTFSTGGQPLKKIEDFEEIISNSAKFASHGSAVDIYYNISSELWPVKVDKGQMGQVIHNLVINAIQAMGNKGSITIDALNVEISDNDMLDLTPGQYVRTSVSDSGPGIPEDILPKIFDLYFSTKPKGSGLGLAICYSIVINHGGTLMVDSKLSKGATFTFYLPAYPGSTKMSDKKIEELHDLSGKVLILEDEELVGKSLKYMLKKFKISVTLTTDGSDTIREYKESLDNLEPFDVVILDLTVPGGMGGREVIQELKRLDPNVKAILSTGYAYKDVIKEHKELGFKEILLKPYKITSLSETLNNLLNE